MKFSFEVIAQLTTGVTRFADRGIARQSAYRQNVFGLVVSEDIIPNKFVLIAIAVASYLLTAIALRSNSYECFAEFDASRFACFVLAHNHRAYQITTLAVFNFKLSTCCANGFIHKYNTTDIV